MGSATSWDPESYAANARFVADLGEPLLDLLLARPREWILDLGCGDGALTEKIAAVGAVVYGADSSFAQAAAARRRGLDALVMDARQIALQRVFDGVFTNAVLHWIKTPEPVLRGVAACLKPGGRFVGEFGGLGNVETIRAALHAGLQKRGIDPWSVDPWYYPAPDEWSQLLASEGFAVAYCELIPRPTHLPGDIRGWLDVFAQPFTRAVRESEREPYLEEVRRITEPGLRHRDGTWYADYVRLRFKAFAPG